MSFLVWYGAEADVSKNDNKKALCALNKWILASQTKCCHKATVSHQPSELSMASQEPVYGRLVIHPCILPNCTVIHSKGQIPNFLCLKTNAYSFLKQLFSFFLPHAHKDQSVMLIVYKMEASTGTGEEISGLVSHHSNGDINLVYI